MLKYHVVTKRNPITKDVKFYAQIDTPDPLTMEAIAKMIAQNCTLTRHDIVACLSAFQEQMINALQEGRSVRLNDLGSFRVTMHSLGATSEAEFNVSNITDLHIRFTPAARLRKALRVGADGVSLSRVALPKGPGSGPALGE